MGISGTPRVEKHPGEEFTVGFIYTTDKLPTGVTIASSLGSATKLSDLTDVTGTLLTSPTATIDLGGLRASLRVIDGEDGEDYEVKFTHTLTSGDVFVDCLVLQVRECT